MGKANIFFSVVLFLTIPLSFQASSQVNTNDSHIIGISFSSFGENDVIRFQRLDGAAGYSGEGYFALGLYHVKHLNDWLQLEAGIEYVKHKIKIYPNVPPNFDRTPQKYEFSLLSLPVSVRASFWKYFFVNGGFLFDVDLNSDLFIDSQTGIGGVFGLGMQYDLPSRLTLFINPYVKIHALLPFSREKYPTRTLESGFRFGVGWRY